MTDAIPRYDSGEEVRAGDRVRLAGRAGRVVFVLGSGVLPGDWAASEEWFAAEYGAGFMLDVEGMGHVFQNVPDEDLQFLGRAGPAGGGVA